MESDVHLTTYSLLLVYAMNVYEEVLCGSHFHHLNKWNSHRYGRELEGDNFSCEMHEQERK